LSLPAAWIDLQALQPEYRARLESPVQLLALPAYLLL